MPVPSSPRPGSSTCTSAGSSPLATDSARLVTPSDMAPTRWPRPLSPNRWATSARCSATPSLVTGPASTCGRITGRTAATQGSAATASSRSTGTAACTRPACGSATPGTAVNSAEEDRTLTPSAASCAELRLADSAVACSCRSRAPEASTPTRSEPSVRRACVLSVAERLVLRSVRSLAACWRTSDGILAATASGVDAAAGSGAAAAGSGAADAGPGPTARDRTTAPTAAAASEDLRTSIPFHLEGFGGRTLVPERGIARPPNE